jgi:hypothetical protein
MGTRLWIVNACGLALSGLVLFIVGYFFVGLLRWGRGR